MNILKRKIKKINHLLLSYILKNNYLIVGSGARKVSYYTVVEVGAAYIHQYGSREGWVSADMDLKLK